MYVHLGGGLIVAVNDVVAILDVRLLQAADINREFVEGAIEAKRLWGDGIPPECKSLVVTTAGVFASAISAPTLARRMTHLQQSALAWEAET